MFDQTKCCCATLTLVCVLAFLIDKCDAFGFPSSGGGGGCGGGCGGCGGGCGGCGGGCGGYGGGCGAIAYCAPPPPPPCVACTCGKRKKRSILEQQLKTHETNLCPQSAWKKTIAENIGEDSVSSQHAIQGAMFSDFENHKFFVNCMKRTNVKTNTTFDGKGENVPIKFVSNGDAYCSTGNNKIWCTVAALMG